MTSKLLTAIPLAPIDEVLTWLIQSTVLLTVGLLAGRFLKGRGPAVQSALYRTILVAVLVCPIASLAIAAMGFPGLVIRVPSAAADDKIVIPDRGPDRVGPIARQDSGAIPTSFDRRAIAPSTSEPPSVLSPRTTAELVESVTVRDWIALLASIILASWLMGTAILAARMLVGHRLMARLRGTAIPAEPEAQALCHELAGRMRLRLPGVLRSPFLSSPCLDGLRRPAILLPEDAEQHLRDTFVHELAHLGRRDGLWNLLRQMATAALWVQPLLWVLSRRIEETAEEVCDDFVVAFGADRGRYAGHLLELAERRLLPLAPSGVGMISLRSLLARRIARILDSSRTLSTWAGARAIAATLLAGLVGTLLAGLIGVGGANIEVLGDEPKDEKPQTTLNPSPSTPRKTVSEPKDVPITGRIVDLEGRPIAGVSVRVLAVTRAKGGNLTPWLEAVERGEPARTIRTKQSFFEQAGDATASAPEVTTDSQGRFRLDGLPAEALVDLRVEGPTIAFGPPLAVVTRRFDPNDARRFASAIVSAKIHGADFTEIASPGRAIEGIVRDAKTNRPLVGVKIQSEKTKTRNPGPGSAGKPRTITDAQGRFRLLGMPKGDGNRIIAVPNNDQPYFMQELDVPDPPGIDAVPVEFAMHQGNWVEGKVTDKATGQPISGAKVHYLPFLENPFAQVLPEFRKDGVVHGSTSHQDHFQTRLDGTYRLVGLPGHAIVGVDSGDKPYRTGDGTEAIKGMNDKGWFPTWSNPVPPGKYWPNAMKEINPPVGSEVVHVDFALERGASFRVRIVDLEGKPVTGVTVSGRASRGASDRGTQPTAEFDILDLSRDEDRMVMVRHDSQKIGKVVHVHEKDALNGVVVVALEPLATITGLIADADGNPVPGAMVRANLLPSGDSGLQLDGVATGKDGRFRISDVPVGCEYSLMVNSGATVKERKFAFSNKQSVRPGEVTDVGEIKLKD